MEASEESSSYLWYFLSRGWFAGDPWYQPPCKFQSVGLDVSWTSILFHPINAFGISPIRMLAFLFLSSVLLLPGTVEVWVVNKWVLEFATYTHIPLCCSGGCQSPVNLLSFFVELLGACLVFPFPSPQLIIVRNACFTVYLNLLVLSCSKVLQTLLIILTVLSQWTLVKKIDCSLEFRLWIHSYFGSCSSQL